MEISQKGVSAPTIMGRGCRTGCSVDLGEEEAPTMPEGLAEGSNLAEKVLVIWKGG